MLSKMHTQCSPPQIGDSQMRNLAEPPHVRQASSPQFTTSHLVTILNYYGFPKSYLQPIFKVMTATHITPLSHDRIWGAWQPTHLYDCLQHPAISRSAICNVFCCFLKFISGFWQKNPTHWGKLIHLSIAFP